MYVLSYILCDIRATAIMDLHIYRVHIFSTYLNKSHMYVCMMYVCMYVNVICICKCDSMSLNVSKYIIFANLCLRVRENGCPWDFNICAEASLGGHLEILQWDHCYK